MVWHSTIPTTATNIMDMAVYFPQNWVAIEDILSEEHYGFSSVLSGRHMPGTAVLCSDATTGITGVTPPGSGALAFDETLGSLMAYLNSSWTWVATFPGTHVRAYISGGDQSIPSSGAIIEFDAETDDGLNEYDTNTYKFTPLADGYFLVKATMSIIAAGGIDVIIKIVHTDTDGNTKNMIDSPYVLSTSNSLSIITQAIVEAEAGDKIYIVISHDRTVNIIVESGADRSVLTIKRLS